MGQQSLGSFDVTKRRIKLTFVGKLHSAKQTSKAAFWLKPRGNPRPISIVENFTVGIFPIEFRVNYLTVEINRMTQRTR